MTFLEPTSPSTESWALARRYPRLDDLRLLTDTKDLLAHLPKGVRPHQLAQHYPRIANEIRLHWPATEPLLTYLMSLTVDQRGNRIGFPALVDEEIRALVQYVAQRNDIPQVHGAHAPVVAT